MSDLLSGCYSALKRVNSWMAVSSWAPLTEKKELSILDWVCFFNGLVEFVTPLVSQISWTII